MLSYLKQFTLTDAGERMCVSHWGVSLKSGITEVKITQNQRDVLELMTKWDVAIVFWRVIWIMLGGVSSPENV